MSECRSCHKEIEWVSLNGKPHPIDTKTQKVLVKQPVLSDGKTHVKFVESVVSHFATCADAKDWRKK